ncbi:MAG: phosphoglycolate phosphatase [Hyphomonas sp.]
MKEAIVFDLDGTLVDSAPDIAAAANRMLDDFGHRPLPDPLLRSFIGHGIPQLVRKVIASLDLNPSLHPDWNARMLAQYSDRPAELTRPYPGVIVALETLAGAGHPLGLCTNKFHGLSMQVLEALDMDRLFQVVIGGDSLSVRKPDPAPLQAAFAALPTPPLLYVGDSEVDAETAQAGGYRFALFTQGYRKTPVEELPHHVAFDRFDALQAIVNDCRSLRGKVISTRSAT